MLLDFSTTRHVFNPFLLTSAPFPSPAPPFANGSRISAADSPPPILATCRCTWWTPRLPAPAIRWGLAARTWTLPIVGRSATHWRGRGACLALDLQQVADNAAREDGNEEAQKAVFVRHAIALALHELGHVLSRPRLFNPDSDQAQMEKPCPLSA